MFGYKKGPPPVYGNSGRPKPEDPIGTGTLLQDRTEGLPEGPEREALWQAPP